MNNSISITRFTKATLVLATIIISGYCLKAQSYSIFNADTEIPNIINNYDGQPITVGIKFKTTQNGVINGIRYYQGNTSVDNGAHTGLLYSSSGGTPLASATFASISSFQGWTQVLFSTPVAVTAGTLYVAAVFSAGGYYQAISPTAALRLTGAINRTPLIAIADNDAQGPNAIYNYSPGGTPVFPTQSFQANNYFVDVIFTPLITGISAGNWASYGNFSYNTNSGIVVIGPVPNPIPTDAGLKLAVNGTINAKKIKVTQTGWADYVFDASYKLRSLNDLETYIKKNQHLPELPATSEVEKNGIDVGDNQAVLLKKIEELTLYLIKEHNEIENLKKVNQQLKSDNRQIKKLIRPHH